MHGQYNLIVAPVLEEVDAGALSQLHVCLLQDVGAKGRAIPETAYYTRHCTYTCSPLQTGSLRMPLQGQKPRDRHVTANGRQPSTPRPYDSEWSRLSYQLKGSDVPAACGVSFHGD